MLSRNRATSQLKAKMKEWLKSYTGFLILQNNWARDTEVSKAEMEKKELCLHVSQDKGQ